MISTSTTTIPTLLSSSCCTYFVYIHFYLTIAPVQFTIINLIIVGHSMVLFAAGRQITVTRRIIGKSRAIINIYFCGCSLMVKPQPSKLAMWVRFPSPAFSVRRVKTHFSALNQVFLITYIRTLLLFFKRRILGLILIGPRASTWADGRGFVLLIPGWLVFHISCCVSACEPMTEVLFY